MIDRLLHICNSYPYCLGDNGEFYALKSQLLAKYGRPDGYDVQSFEGKKCWTCNGTGWFTHLSGDRDVCDRCYGGGWHRWPVWITLKRYRFGRFLFHTPDGRSYEKPKPSVTTIEGYVNHRHYGWRVIEHAAKLLPVVCQRDDLIELCLNKFKPAEQRQLTFEEAFTPLATT